MVKLRMARFGRRNNAFYRIVAIDSRFARNGRFIERVGFFNPKTNELHIDKNLITKWVKFGAILSNSVKSLLKKTI